MKPRLLYYALLTLGTACQQERDVLPSQLTLADEVVGTYRTNVYLDPSNVATPAGQLPYAVLERESDNAVTLVFTRQFPEKEVRQIPHVGLRREGSGIVFQLVGSTIGVLQADRVFTSSGMEKQDSLLRITLPNTTPPDTALAPLVFAGLRQP